MAGTYTPPGEGGYSGGYQAQGYHPQAQGGGYAPASGPGYTPVGTAPPPKDYDVEAAQAAAYLDWSDTMVRHGFIRKVYGILSVQLGITLATTLLFIYNAGVQDFVFSHPGMLWSAYGIMLFVIICLACCGNVRRQYPTNYILLSVFTLATSYLVGTISATYSTDTVLLALVMTMGVTIGLTIYAFQTKRDFTMMGGFLFSMLFIFVIWGFLMIWYRGPIANTLYAGAGAIIFSLYIVYDTQLIIGGKHKKYQLSPDEYVFAALNIYLDVINLFLYILALLGNRR
uniref:Uncharacterized protein n=1 Tax=Bicosoecida sp. CB-2014 TaxID=1486930 RepID=A0A7S1G727_9STRA|mmetsp:Transcript_21247/g.74934  ORF Transcript_21247/g.74934 Transcript_21247/m.74934 type:complete len:285 (+) Transcript_21247:172-1026(+)